MHENTPAVAATVRNGNTLAEKLAALRGAYQDEVAYILTAGPSINSLWSQRVVDFLQDKLVIAIKQTYKLCRGIADFHLLNSWNYEPYDYIGKPIVISEYAENDPDTPGLVPDIMLHISDPRDFRRRLATSLEFDQWLFSKTYSRPWGPGIVYELASYLVIHAGIRQVVIAGWDLGELNSPGMPHFFDKAQDPKVSRLANRPRIRPFEVGDIARSTPAFYYWLRSKGVGLFLVSDQSLVDPVVPRLGSIDANLTTPYVSRIIEAIRGSRHADRFLQLWDIKPDNTAFLQTRRQRDGFPIYEMRRINGSSDPSRIVYSLRYESAFIHADLCLRVFARCTTTGDLSVEIVARGGDGEVQPISAATASNSGGDAWECLEVTKRLALLAQARTIDLAITLVGTSGQFAELCAISADLIYPDIFAT